MNPEKIGKLIKSLRMKQNLSQTQLAQQLNVTSQAISKWENGRGIPDIEMLKKLCEIFNLNMDDLIRGEERKSDSKKIKKIIIITSILLLGIIGISTFFILTSKQDSFHFSALASDNHKFSIKGVVAYDNKKKSIYISDINYDDQEEENEYLQIECILYEKSQNTETKISQCGNINTSFQNKKSGTTLSKLLKEVEFNIDNYDCSCSNNSCKNLYLKINALDTKNKVVTYNIPLQVNDKCEPKK